jgi:hypothetical protein
VGRKREQVYFPPVKGGCIPLLRVIAPDGQPCPNAIGFTGLWNPFPLFTLSGLGTTIPFCHGKHLVLPHLYLASCNPIYIFEKLNKPIVSVIFCWVERLSSWFVSVYLLQHFLSLSKDPGLSNILLLGP